MRQSTFALHTWLLLVAILAGCDDLTSPQGTQIIAIAAGNGYTCALDADGKAHCWGANDVGQLGRGTTSEMEGVGAVAGDLAFEAIAAGDHNVCGVADGRAYCWGEGSLLDRDSPLLAPVVVEPATATFVSVTVGGRHACGLTAAGEAWCWGKNDELGGGQLGNGTLTSSGTATPVVGGIAFDQVTAGFLHTCGRAAGRVLCWGSNFGEAVGLTDRVAIAEPTEVALEVAAAALGAGALVSCAGATSGIHCWGTNSAGQLGRGTSGGSDAAPAAVAGTAGLSGIASGSVNRIISHVCALSGGGQALCWGANDQGQLGRSTAETCTLSGSDPFSCATTPGVVETELQFAGFAVGADHTCGLAGGTAHCWGGNNRGQLGAPGPGSTTPVPVDLDGS